MYEENNQENLGTPCEYGRNDSSREIDIPNVVEREYVLSGDTYIAEINIDIQPFNSPSGNIFVPGYTPQLFPCVVIQNATTIRAYRQMPANNTTRQFTDFFFNAGARYMAVNGTQTFSNTATLPTCIPQSQLTNNWWHRTDLDSILIIFIILAIFMFYIPLKIVNRLFRKGH